MLSLFGGFHDGYLREIHIWTDWCVDEDRSARRVSDNGTALRMLLQRQWPNPSAIELLFQDVIVFHLVASERGYDADMYDGTLTHREDGTFFWADDWIEDLPGEKTTWVTSRGLFWREASDGMGPTLRYGDGEFKPQDGEQTYPMMGGPIPGLPKNRPE